jgi:hypothetical protein
VICVLSARPQDQWLDPLTLDDLGLMTEPEDPELDTETTRTHPPSAEFLPGHANMIMTMLVRLAMQLAETVQHSVEEIFAYRG